jgi:hypothetical protein
MSNRIVVAACALTLLLPSVVPAQRDFPGRGAAERSAGAMSDDTLSLNQLGTVAYTVNLNAKTSSFALRSVRDNLALQFDGRVRPGDNADVPTRSHRTRSLPVRTGISYFASEHSAQIATAARADSTGAIRLP